MENPDKLANILAKSIKKSVDKKLDELKNHLDKLDIGINFERLTEIQLLANKYAEERYALGKTKPLKTDKKLKQWDYKAKKLILFNDFIDSFQTDIEKKIAIDFAIEKMQELKN